MAKGLGPRTLSVIAARLGEQRLGELIAKPRAEKPHLPTTLGVSVPASDFRWAAVLL